MWNKNIIYFFSSKNWLILRNFQKNIKYIINSFFNRSNSIVSQPIFKKTSDKLIILLFIYIANLPQLKEKFQYKLKRKKWKKLTKVQSILVKAYKWIQKDYLYIKKRGYNKKIIKIKNLKKRFLNLFVHALGKVISKLNLFVNLPIDTELRIIRLSYPILNSDILSKYYTKKSLKEKHKWIIKKIFSILKRYAQIQNKWTRYFKKNTIYKPLLTSITGLKFKISGRLSRDKISKRRTVKVSQIGYVSLGKASAVNFGKFTAKSHLGAFTVKTWIGTK
jgi:hypothetical protein